MSVDARAWDRLTAYFRRHSNAPENIRVLAWEPLTGGYSRLMSRVTVEDSGAQRTYVLRTDPPAGTSIVETNRADEWELVNALMAEGSVPVVRALWFEESAITGSPAIVWEFHGGRTLHAHAIAGEPAHHLALAPQLAEIIAKVHSVDLETLPARVRTEESWQEYVERRIREWETVEAGLCYSNPVMRLVAAWMRANRPAAGPLRLVHGDFNANNVMVDAEGRYSLIDWELAHVGDPREDLGWFELLGINQPPFIIAADPAFFYERYRTLMGFSREQVNPATIAWFTIFGAGTVYLQVVQRLDALARGGVRSINAAYSTCAVAGMNNVFLGAIDRHRAMLREFT